MYHDPFAMTKPSYMHPAKVPFMKKRSNVVVSGVGLPRVIAMVTVEEPTTRRMDNKTS